MARPARFELTTSAFGGRGRHQSDGVNASRHSEISANLLNGLRSNFRDFSERALIDNANHLDFDSAIPRFESWRPSQPVPSLWGGSGSQKSCATFPRVSRTLRSLCGGNFGILRDIRPISRASLL